MTIKEFLSISVAVFLALLFSSELLGHERSSSIALIDNTLVVANQHSDSITFVPLNKSLNETFEINVGRSPQSVAFDNDDAIWITSQNENIITIVSVSERKVIGQLKTGLSPFGVVFDDSVAYISNQNSNSIQVIDKNNFAILALIPVASQPRGLSLSPDKSTLYVTHFLSGLISIINTKTLKVDDLISLGDRVGLTQSLSIDSKNRLAYIPNTVRNTDNKNLRFDTSVFPSVSIIDIDSNTHLRSSRIALDVIDQPVGIPLESIIVGNILFVLNAASNDLTAINLTNKKSIGHLELGSFPIGLINSTDNKYLYIDNSLDGTVSIIEIESMLEISVIKVAELNYSQEILEGIRLFHTSNDIRMAKDQWISCATCHFDGKTDNLVWNFPDGLRNTPSLMGISFTAPFHWSGNLDEIQDVESTIRNLQGGIGLAQGPDNCSPSCDNSQANTGRSQSLDNLAAFIKSLRFPISEPLYAKGQQANASREKGEIFFLKKESNCASCHVPPTYTDNLNHEILSEELTKIVINTPSLLGIKYSAPYLHDGSVKNLLTMFLPEPDGKHHGEIANGDISEIPNLISFLESLESIDNLTVKGVFQNISSPDKKPIETPRSSSTINVDQSEIDEYLSLAVSYKHSSNVAFDTYLVLEHVYTNTYWLVNFDLSMIDISRSTTIKPTEVHTGPSDLHQHNLPVVSLPISSLTKDPYKIHIVNVESNQSPLELVNWLSYDVVSVYL